MSKVPIWIRQHITALFLLLGATGTVGGVYIGQQDGETQAQHHEYVMAVAQDAETSTAVKVAMVMGAYYESSGRHIGTPYVDKLGKGRPLTVCNGITGAGVVAGKWYSPGDCYQLEKGRYLESEKQAAKALRYWGFYDPFAQATFIDFIHNKGPGAFETSTMRRLANLGNLQAACQQNPRWNKGTVNGVSTVLPGLKLRGDSNGEICSSWRME